jgi:S-DNA-T family DNA segregation ATPase FtsK/SpoIIIE
MAERKRNELKNTVKDPAADLEIVENIEEKQVEEVSSEWSVSPAKQEGPKTPKKERKEKKVKPTFSEKIKQAFAFIHDERFQKICGLTFLLSSAYLFIAFSSFMFTWQADYDKVVGGLGTLFSPDVKVDNWLGKIGALSSHLFIHKWFGIASFAFVLVGLILGVRILFKISLLPLGKTSRYSFFALIWLSITLGYIFTNNYFYFGGGFGYTVSLWLNSIVGTVGTGFLLGFSALIFMVLAFNMSFNLFTKKPEEQIIEAELQSQPVMDIKQPVFVEPEIKTVNTFKENIEAAVDTMISDADDVEEEEELIAEAEEGEAGDVQFTVIEKVEEVVEETATADALPFGEYDPTLDLSSYQMPHLDLLEQYSNKEASVNAEELNTNKDRIVSTLNNYGIQIEKIKATIGPTVTLYEIIPAAGVRISKIKNLEDDIALSLSALGIRIIAPIPGKGTIGIEVPNLNPEMVAMRTILASEKFQNSTMDLPIALGKTISNETFIADLAKMPHLLMAGATGQGKSVGLNAILVSLLYKKHPSQIKFVLVDPKKVELTLFNKIERHFLAKLPDTEEAIITDTKKVVHTLNSLCIEMDQRYDLLKDAQVRNLKEYNAKFIARKLNPNNGHKFLPYIVLVIDEFADLIMTAGKEIETPIARLAQLARAIGIHLIIATQRPSVNIITGTIKANFPARIAFRVTSKIDSRTILDSGGAEQLIGRGDMLLSTGSDLIRLQCAFVDTPEVDKITDFIGSQRSYPEAFKLPEYVDESAEGGSAELDASERDALFADAARIVVQHQQGSASLLQRRLKLGYNRAGRIVDQLEAAGIIGQFEGSKAREVLIKDMMSLEQFLNNSSKTPAQ